MQTNEKVFGAGGVFWQSWTPSWKLTRTTISALLGFLSVGQPPLCFDQSLDKRLAGNGLPSHFSAMRDVHGDFCPPTILDGVFPLKTRIAVSKRPRVQVAFLGAWVSLSILVKIPYASMLPSSIICRRGNLLESTGKKHILFHPFKTNRRK